MTLNGWQPPTTAAKPLDDTLAMDVLSIVVGIYNIVIGLTVGVINLPRARKKIRPTAPEKHRVARDRHRLFFIWSGVLIAIGRLFAAGAAAIRHPRFTNTPSPAAFVLVMLGCGLRERARTSHVVYYPPRFVRPYRSLVTAAEPPALDAGKARFYAETPSLQQNAELDWSKHKQKIVQDHHLI